MDKAHMPVVEQCIKLECDRLVEHDGGWYCKAYINPSYWWSKGRCPIPFIEPGTMGTKKKGDPRKWKRSRKADVPTRKYMRTGKGRRKDYIDW